MEQRNCTAIVSDGGTTMEVFGLFLYKEYAAGEDSARAFLQEFIKDPNEVSFDDCLGVHRVHMTFPDGRQVFFSDNAGMSCWFIHMASRTFSQTLQGSVSPVMRRPNYRAVAQFLYLGCVYGRETVLDGVFRSAPETYYIVSEGKIEEREKGLLPLEAYPADRDALKHLMEKVVCATKGMRLGCAITGGTDSRAVLSHLIANGCEPVLTITGSEDHVDVKIARMVAETVNRPLCVFSDVPEEQAWLKDTVKAADGMKGPCGIYRLFKQTKGLWQAGVQLKFGGGAGEIYKNSFINQDFPFYRGKPNWKKFLHMKVIPYAFPDGICAGETAAALKRMPDELLKEVQQETEEKKAVAYLKVGYKILQDRGITVGMMENQFYAAYTPLMERPVVASALQYDPYHLEMQAWQRREVSVQCPAIKKIPTDRGLTCDRNRIAAEWLKSMLFLLRVAGTRLFFRRRVAGRIDACFEEGLSAPEYKAAVERCKELGILRADVTSLPKSVADAVFAVGSLFQKPHV